ncbi:MAG: permease [Gammaproteobacteria bacterium]|nr:permease [Gammaproteobacteria bacterium]MBU1969284.1 permease [Gammaproteobacteria bacterium]
MLIELLSAGLAALNDYIATHVLTCLVPAFLLAGAMVTFIRREAILALLGERVSKFKSFPLAAGSSFLVAACSCTVIPVASGLYYAGAGIGAAFIVLWVAPASNILALTYTGTILGGEMVVARVVASLLMAFVVGMVMSYAFRDAPQPPRARAPTPGPASKDDAFIDRRSLILIGLLVLTLLLPNYLVQSGPYLLKVGVWGVLTLVTAAYAWWAIEREQLQLWLQETWWFVRIIFPLLLAGVFVVGIVGYLLPEAWVREWLGGNSLMATFLATLIGSVTYFATMTEAPFVHTLMGLGMGKGPALALLLCGPGLSLPNWLAIARVFGVRQAMVYVPTIIVLSTAVGWVFGNFIL